MEEWIIQPSTGQCTSCNKAFAEKEDFYSALYDRNSEFMRQDFCVPCWEKWQDTPYSFWKTQKPETREEKRIIDNASLLELFHKLDQEDKLRKRQFRYLLGLLLVRRKVFRMRDVERGSGPEVMELVDAKTKEVYRLERPSMAGETLQDLTKEIDKLFGIESHTELNSVKSSEG